jgi:hypothetical protein
MVFAAMKEAQRYGSTRYLQRLHEAIDRRQGAHLLPIVRRTPFEERVHGEGTCHE